MRIDCILFPDFCQTHNGGHVNILDDTRPSGEPPPFAPPMRPTDERLGDPEAHNREPGMRDDHTHAHLITHARPTLWDPEKEAPVSSTSEERERRTVCGVAERGTAAGYRADGGQRRDGVGGWVRAHGGDYADAQSKGFGLTLLHTETSGAIAGALDALLRRYDRLSRAVGTVDTTEYGQSPASPRTYYRHHLAAHSAAVVFADVVTIHDDVQHLGSQLTRA